MTLFPIFTYIQQPEGLPQADNNTPIDFTSASDLLLYVVLPVLLVLFYFWWRRSKHKGS